MSAVEVFLRFLWLGCTSFGGPTAHLGYFREALVERRKWLSEPEFANTLALCQFLPGPGSSQTAFAIGLHRAGLVGGLASFVGFTLPSFLLMLGLAVLDASVTEAVWFRGCVDALKLLAVAVVAHAVIGMGQQFFKGVATWALGLATALVLLWMPGIWSQIVVLVAAAAVGVIFFSSESQDKFTFARRQRVVTPGPPWLYLTAFFSLLLLLPMFAAANPLLELFSDLVRVGSLVFGGGHVVLPLLQAALDGVTSEEFLVGYAAAQGVPGPMFTLGSYLGAVVHGDAPLVGALVATAGIFLPGFLLVLGLRDRWMELAALPRLAGGFAGVNAAVVGLLLAAFVHPIWTSAIRSVVDLVVALVMFSLLRFAKLGVIWLVLGALVFGLVRGTAGLG